MRVLIERRAASNALRWLQRGLFACAFVLLSYWIFVSADTWMFQRIASQRIARDELREGPAVVHRPIEGDLIGQVDVDRLGVSVAVVEGADAPDLDRAAGHVPGTSLPGEKGNTAIAAHRDTFFRPLRNVRPKDVIRVTTRNGEYRYQVVSTKIVRPEDVSVLASDRSEVLTLVTCYPFFFVGAAPKRFIVRAERLQPDGQVAHLY